MSWLAFLFPSVRMLKERLVAAERERIAAEARWVEAQAEVRNLREQISQLYDSQQELQKKLIDHFSLRSTGRSIFEAAPLRPAPDMGAALQERVVTGSAAVAAAKERFLRRLKGELNGGDDKQAE